MHDRRGSTAGPQPTPHEVTRLARDLHDGVLQELAACRMLLTALGDVTREDAAEVASAARDALDAGIAELRALTLELRHGGEAAVTLAALRADVARVRSRSGLDIAYVCDESVRAALRGPEGAARAHGLRRCVQEALSNVTRHAGPCRVEVELRARAGTITCVVRDDGSGFDRRAASSGLGLLGMAERASELGGRCKVRSRAGEGTTVRLQLPGAKAGAAAA